MDNNDREIISKEQPKNPYLTKDHIPEIKIKDKNKIICDEKEYEIKDYIKKINNSSNNFHDDIIIYNHCEKCKKDLNEYFCKNCYLNLCDKCHEKCNVENHDFINLNEMKEKSDSFYIKKIKIFLKHNIIPMKDVKENSNNGQNNEDILLIIEIISQDYMNFFHFENIMRILKYIDLFYTNNYSHEKYEGFGKLIFENGNYYIGQFKDGLPNGKGIEYYKNGNIMFDGNFINGKKMVMEN